MGNDRGFNQYRQGPQDKDRTKPRAATGEVAVGAECFTEPSTEEVAWRFHPEYQQWREAGFSDWDEYRSWTESGGSLTEAREWTRRLDLVDQEDAVDRVCRRAADAGEPPLTKAYVLRIESPYGYELVVTVDKQTAISELCDYGTQAASASRFGGELPADPRLATWRYFEDAEEPVDLCAVAAPQDAIRSGEVEVLCITTEYGNEFFVGASGGTKQHLVDYVRKWWDRELGDVAECPEDDGQAVEEYFANVDLESYETTVAKVAGPYR